MEITESQLAFIREDIRNRGITLDSLADNLVDHICCVLEIHPGTDFDSAYLEVLGTFGEKGIAQIQQETILLLNINKEEKMKKAIYLTGFIATFLATTGLLFTFFHWKGASIILMMGFLFLNFGFLPLFFMDRYKRAVS
ncbi:MAG: hypothetical protein ACYC1Q_00015 [Bacteroidia bacterium]